MYRANLTPIPSKNMKPVHISIDLETLGTDPDSLVLSIGAVVFNEDEILEAMSFYPTIESQQAYGARINHDTFLWWLKQSAEARMALVQDERFPMEEELAAFAERLSHYGHDISPWGNGSSFDIAILNYHLGKNGVEKPWKFWNERCMREAVKHHPQVTRVKSEQPHEALADAMAQAKTIQAILKAQSGQ